MTVKLRAKKVFAGAKQFLLHRRQDCAQFWEWVLARKWARLSLLGICAVLGLGYGPDIQEWVVCFFDFKEGSAIEKYTEPLAVGILVFICLWIFRTHDTQRQMQQRNYFNGLEHLASGDPMKILVGVNMLLEVSKATSAFDGEIRAAFLNRLKRLPNLILEKQVSEMRVKRLTYAQYILQWFIAHPNPDDNFDGLDCRFQEFMLKLQLNKIFPKENGIQADFREANFKWSNFSGVDVSFYDFRHADLVSINGALLQKKFYLERKAPAIYGDSMSKYKVQVYGGKDSLSDTMFQVVTTVSDMPRDTGEYQVKDWDANYISK